ncbi:DEAD box ATP-dependent RNA helicase, putative [Plasmodium yoelii]|uniref:ATP-dependent RNA helicase n=2 Tax=Plasmodium yoelii TaxID=5861 RepID=A0AAF0B3G7_PLAYO|nr:DEAD box ATP-dependent RNA helicase, putative [Plasmodium yoelii]WBY56024.1 DEAD box ATP-dependent RNA helicase [Plasmodium yoelii yoelii]CDU17006.1 DEAD box ATP-dependent RNA helicase, putative [Plasmodium yoelii]VTZ75386.1 DEAD box ATP-dependent RNA helicase, putative [Plasmodium yoelii]|eukprot:XP_022813172.1 DEAD box ATP-dependent RNA helicase, putative [Plasmodium yoelii]
MILQIKLKNVKNCLKILTHLKNERKRTFLTCKEIECIIPIADDNNHPQKIINSHAYNINNGNNGNGNNKNIYDHNDNDENKNIYDHNDNKPNANFNSQHEQSNYLANFANEQNKIVYDNINDLNEFCLKKFKKIKSELCIQTSSNREYIPFHFYDTFLSNTTFQKNCINYVDNVMNLNGPKENSFFSFEKADKNNEENKNNDGACKTLNNIKNNSEHNNKNMTKSEISSKIIFNKSYIEKLCKYKYLQNINIDSYIKLSLLKNFNIKYLTTNQYCLFPLFFKDLDLLVYSFKGSGKTVGYAIPLLHKIIIQINKLKKYHKIKENYVHALIICPNIILVEQTYNIIKKLIMYHPCNIICHYIHGRKNMNMQGEINELKKKKPHIIITTPVSFINHIKYSTSFSNLFFLCDTIIIDEAYFLLNQNYLKNILIIKNILPKGHQTILLTCIVNNFLKQLAYRLLRLNYLYLNFVHNCIFDNNIFYSSILMNTINFNSNDKSFYQKYYEHVQNLQFQLYHKFNDQLLQIYQNNILNCDDIGKLWYAKDSKMFYEHVNKFNSFIVHTQSERSETKQLNAHTNDLINFKSEFSKNQNNKNCINKQDKNIIYYNDTSYETNKPFEEIDNEIVMENKKKCNDIYNIERGTKLDQTDSISKDEEKNNNLDMSLIEKEDEEYKYEGPEEKIRKLKLSNSDYNNYKMYDNNNNNYEQNKGKNIPTHIFLKQEYLIYDSDKFALILFNIIHKEIISNNLSKIVIIMPTVKMLQFIYAIFKHYIFKGYLFLLYLKCNHFKNNFKDNIVNNFCNSFYYDKENVNFSISSNPFVFTDLAISQININDKPNVKENKILDDKPNVKENKIFDDKPNVKENKIFDDKPNVKEDNSEKLNYEKEFEALKDIVILCLHSKLSLDKKMYTLDTFNNNNENKKGKKKILFSSSLLYQGIEIDNVDLVIQVGIRTNIDEYILTTNISTSKNTAGRSLLLLNELEGHYLYCLYKNNIMISSVGKDYLNYLYKDNNILEYLLKYKRDRKIIPQNYNKEDITNLNDLVIEYKNENKEKNNKYNYFYNYPLKHIEWHTHKHLLCSCELMYRSLLGFYCEKNNFLKYEKWQVPSLIKNIIYSFGYFENFYITKCMAARLQIINAPDLYIKFNATPKSVLMSSLPSYKGYKSKINELKQKHATSSFDLQENSDPCDKSYL